MSGGAPPRAAGDGKDLGVGVRIGIVVARWHGEITERLLAGAREAAAESGVAEGDVTVVRVPGAFEVPVAAQRLAQRPDIDAVVALAVVVRGGTPHFEYVCRAVTNGCTRVALDSGKPLGFGVLTVDTIDQAVDRAGGAHGDKGREALDAVLETVQALHPRRTDREA